MRMNGGRSGAKRMRRRGGGGGAKPRSLRLDVESAIDKCSTVDQLVNHLRLAVPRYERYKVRPFTKSVAKIVADLSRKYSDIDGGHGGDIPITKRRIWTNEKDEKLTVTETQHSGVLNHSVGGPSSTVTSDTYSEGEIEKASLSSDDDDDAIYQEKLEPQFDLLKSILREDLCRKTRKSVDGERREVKQVMEMEVVEHHKDDKEMVHLTKMNGESGDLNVNKINNNNDRNGRNTNIRREKIMLSDFGGIDGVIDELISKVIWPFYHPEMPHHLGVKPITGILLHGPPGCGKTTMAEAIANETGVPLYKISAAALVSGVSGASEENIRELFSKAIRTAPSVVFIDEIDAIASKRENSRGMELRIVTQLLTCMDESRNLVKLVNDNTCSESSNRRPGFVLVIGATNRPDALDPALRRPGRFDREFILSVPDVSARVQILSKLTCNVKTEGHLDLVKIARSTPGFVGADLEGLVDEAGRFAMRRLKHKREAELYKEPKDGACNKHWWQASISEEEMGVLMITMDDFEEALKTVQPSCRREGFSHIPNVTWDDIGGLHLLRKEFDRYIIRPIKFPEVYENHGLDLDTGFLLYGPPGCGKTLIAKAVANEAGANFIHIKGPDLLSKYVGDSELAVRTIFDRARRCSPCIIFFDEVDALTTRRGKEGGWVVERVVNQLLVELDGGADHRKGVYVIGATNRPDVVDSALLRPGRIGKLVYVPLPNPDERGMILKALARNKKIDGNVDLMAIGKDSTCDNFSGADLSNLVNEAAFLSLEEQSSNTNEVHFKRALEKISPSVSQEQINYYNLLSKSVKAS